MPIEINLGMPPAGYAVSAARRGELAQVQYLEFTSTEDGQHFIKRLEGLPNQILQKLPNPIPPSQVDSLLAVCFPRGKTAVYVNEVIPRAQCRASRAIKAGSTITRDDIIEINRLELDVDVPSDAGVLFLFSVGWRKGLFYDFGPVGCPNPTPRKYDLASVLGQAYCHILFQERFSISDAEWNALFAAKWFPFSGLLNSTIDVLIDHVRAGWDPDEKLPEFTSQTKERLPQMLESWRKHSSFAPHIELLERAAERFQSDDYVSCTALLFPRIEGILRTHHTSLGTKAPPSSKNLTYSAVAARMDHEKCLLMPHRFAAYLGDIYFANFNPVAQQIDVSRHSVAHGVASASGFNQKSALLAILVVHQLFYFLECEKPEKA